MLALMVDLEDDPDWSTSDETDDAETDRCDILFLASPVNKILISLRITLF